MKLRINESLDFPSLTNEFPKGYRGMKKSFIFGLFFYFSRLHKIPIA